MVACYILTTWFLDAFNLIGFLWPNGDRGSGKTQLLAVVAELAYLGHLILSGGSFAALRDMADSYDAGRRLAADLPGAGLRAVFVVGIGVGVNGSALVDGMQAVLGRQVALSGGLAGDAGEFRRTWTLGASGSADDQLVAVGF